MKISSLAFLNGDNIPDKYTCKDENISPELIFEDVPAQAKSLALILDDPDAPGGTYTHWVIYNIPPEVREIPENSSPAGTVGKNNAGQNNYMGPCPPSGTHRYFFKLYALDALLDNQSVSDRDSLVSGMQGHIIEQAELMGRVSK